MYKAVYFTSEIPNNINYTQRKCSTATTFGSNSELLYSSIVESSIPNDSKSKSIKLFLGEKCSNLLIITNSYKKRLTYKLYTCCSDKYTDIENLMRIMKYYNKGWKCN